jgi:hypothetical protein
MHAPHVCHERAVGLSVDYRLSTRTHEWCPQVRSELGGGRPSFFELSRETLVKDRLHGSTKEAAKASGVAQLHFQLLLARIRK